MSYATDLDAVYSLITAKFPDNAAGVITPADARLTLASILDFLAKRGPNDSPSGFKSVRFISRSDPRCEYSDHTRDELDPLLMYMGTLLRLDFGAAEQGPEWYELVYDNTPRVPAWSGMQSWRDGHMAPPTPLVPVKWVLHGSTEALAANVPAYSATFNSTGTPPGYPVDFTVTFLLAGERGFYQALVPGQLPAPSSLTGDANWRRLAAPAAAAVFFQRISQATAVALDDDFAATSGRRYAVELGQGRYVELVGTESGRLPMVGICNGEEVRVNVHNSYVERTGEEAADIADLLARFADTPPIPGKLYGVTHRAGGDILCRFDNITGWLSGGVTPGMLVAHGAIDTSTVGVWAYDLGADALTAEGGDVTKAYVDTADANTIAAVNAQKTRLDALLAGSTADVDTFLEVLNRFLADESASSALTSLVATKAPLASAALTGTPTAPTPAAGTNSTRLATTAFVQAVAGLLLSKANNLSDLQDKASAIANLGLAGWLVTQLAYFGVTNNVQEAALPAQSGSGFLRGVPLTLG
ncbi:hypothetical protein, partial [Hymenobacter terricola]|uniref:hypothetical protein n=1 Tax=Hymenobacter terricola TaxID=2819236 RepID=UPI001CF0FCCA